jgi:hypothetical protein
MLHFQMLIYKQEVIMIPQFYCRICALTTLAAYLIYMLTASEARKMHHKLSKRAEGALLHVAR